MLSRLVWLSLAAFAIGTEGFMISGLLPDIAADLKVDVASCGQLVTIFSITYALGAPVFATVFGNMRRKPLLVGALTGFAVANLLAAASQSFLELAGARVLLAVTAATFMPAAYAVAVAVAPPEKRARAISIVAGGLTVAVALGAPIGSEIGAWGDWRMTFALVAVLAFLAVAGLMFGLPRELPLSRIPLAERLSVLRRPEILATLATMTAALAGCFTVFVYLAPLIGSATGAGAGIVTIAMLASGVGGAFGNAIGGRLADRFGSVRVMRIILVLLTLVFLAITPSAALLPPALAAPALVAAFALWGAIGWAFLPAEASRIVQLAPEAAIVSLSLNSSAVYVGVALGAGLGGLVVAFATPADLGIAAAACCLVALAMLALSLRLAERRHRSGGALFPAPAE